MLQHTKFKCNPYYKAVEVSKAKEIIKTVKKTRKPRKKKGDKIDE